MGRALAHPFTDHAARLAGLAALLLGWRPDEFWRATPAELAGVLAVMAGEDDEAAPLDAMMLARLKEKFPDG